MKKLSDMSINEIARYIERNWIKVNYAAAPYLRAMRCLASIHDSYGYDSGKSVVRYFLNNAKGWTGEIAREVKIELNKRLR